MISAFFIKWLLFLSKSFTESAPIQIVEAFETCIAQLYFLPAHRRAIRTTNLLERLFEEERRRLKVVPTLFGERAVLKLMYASLNRATGTTASRSPILNADSSRNFKGNSETERARNTNLL